jgi:hypothetical protein
MNVKLIYLLEFLSTDLFIYLFYVFYLINYTICFHLLFSYPLINYVPSILFNCSFLCFCFIQYL